MPGQRRSERIRIAEDYVRRHRHMSCRGIARLIVAERPDLFDADQTEAQRFDLARTWVRRICGVHPISYASTSDLHRPKHMVYPPAARELPPAEPFILPEYEHVFILADLHIPFHHADAVDAALKAIKREQPDAVILLGDLVDCASLSRHSRHFHAPPVGDELEAAEQFLESLRCVFARGDVVWKFGNHEDRLRRELSLLNAHDAAADIIAARVDVCDLRVHTVEAYRPIRLRDWALLHGHEAGGGRTEHPAATAWRRWGAGMSGVIVGHHHYIDRYIPRGIGGRCSAHVVGCLAAVPPYHAWDTARWTIGYGVFRAQAGHVRHVEV